MDSSNQPAQWWTKLENNTVRCELCPHSCLITEGGRGFCFARQNIKGALFLTAYGRSSGFCIDPIEKKPLYHFYPGSKILSFGTTGCNLGCKFCQNWDISKSKESTRLSQEISPENIAQIAKKEGVKSVAFTYNDPIIFAEYAIDTAKECHSIDIKTVAVTAGYINPEPRKDFFEHMDAANVDLKSINNDFYERLAMAKLQPVLDTLIYIRKKTNTWLEITNLIIPGENDSEEEIKKLCSWVFDNLGTETPIHFSAFHPSFQMINHQSTPASTLTNAREIAIRQGLKYIYTGNIDDLEGATTFCSSCGKAIIERSRHEIKSYSLSANKCNNCLALCAGIYDEKVGI